MYRAFVTAALLSAVVGAPAIAQSEYRHKGLLRTGYSDRQLGPGAWEVSASSHDEGGSIPLALYHAAEIAGANGVAELRVVKQKVRIERMIRRSTGSVIAMTEKTVVTVRAVRTEADRTACEMPDAHRCLTLPVGGLLSAYGPSLRMPAARPGQTPATPVVLAIARTGDPFAGLPVTPPRGGPVTALLRALVGQRPHASATVPPSAYTPLPAVGRPVTPMVQASVPVAFRPASEQARPHAALPLAPRRTSPGAQSNWDERLKAAQPVDSDPRLGWIASD